MHWYFDVLKQYAVFSGRARRQEFWMFVLISTIICVVLNIIDSAANTQFTLHQGVAIDGVLPDPTQIGTLGSLYTLVVLLPSIGVSVRRLHDIGRSGWWWWLNAIVCIGWIPLVVFQVTPGTVGDNKFGPDPIQE
jgi:uncharacterized membrane protein YhaH (DUF805 family)